MATRFSDSPTPPIGSAPSQEKGGPVVDTSGPQAALASWVMSRVSRWREVRDTAYLERWNEYYRLWRGVWSGADKSRNSERSRIIAPALAEAIDLTHAELTDAIFGRERWISVSDDVMDEDKKDVEGNLETLLEDLDNDRVPDAIIKTLQIGCLYGTGTVKISTAVEKVKEYKRGADGVVTPSERDVAVVKVYPLDPREVVPDPAAEKVEDMLGIAHETFVPIHQVHELQSSGFYFPDLISASAPSSAQPVPSGISADTISPEDAVYITEYHGKVPVKHMMALEGVPVGEDMDESELVEAIITIGNHGTTLRAKRNEFWMQDRSIVSYQHESVPGEFWGRGVAEKGYNPQKALDAEIRMRIDSLALVAAPMIAADRARLPRGFDMKVYPGKEWPTAGNPSEVLMPVKFGDLNPATFNQAADLERMVKQGTGAMDPGTALSQGSRRDTMGGTAMMAASTVKRAKRTMHNIENQLLKPLVQKVLWRYMQFAGDRYKSDVKFSVRGAMGMMAREFEQQMQVQLYQITPQESAMAPLILRGIYAMSSSPDKQRMLDAIDAQLAPPTDEAKQEQKVIKDLQLRKLAAEVNKLENEALDKGASAAEHSAKAQGVVLEAQIAGPKLQLEARKLSIDELEAATYAKQVAQSAEEHRDNATLKAADLHIKHKKVTADARKNKAAA